MVKCYHNRNGVILESSYSPCMSTSSDTDFVSCCYSTVGHQCMSNGFCYFPESVPGGSHYYHAHCTDPDYKDPSCFDYCPTINHDDVVYNTTSSSWQCCGSNSDGGLACDKPSGVSFDAPPKNQLYELAVKPTSASYSALPSAQIASASSSAVAALSSLSQLSSSTSSTSSSSPSPSSSTSALTSTTPTAAAATPTSGQNSGQQTNGGAIAGGVVAGLAVAATIAGLIFFFLRKRQRRGDSDSPEPGHAEDYVQQVPPTYVETSKAPVPTKPQYQQVVSVSEMPAHERIPELPGH